MRLSGVVHRYLDQAFPSKEERRDIKAAIAACPVQVTNCTVDPKLEDELPAEKHLVILTQLGVVGLGWPMKEVLWKREVVLA